MKEIAAAHLRSFKGHGYIPTSALKEILHELDTKLTDQELDGIITEIDEDASGTVDFDGNHLLLRQRQSSVYVRIDNYLEYSYCILSFQSSWR